MDRVNISVTILEMVKEFGLNEKQKGWVLSSVYLGYVISMSIGGILADKYGGKTNLRFDDTNPVTEDTEYVESIKADVRWLGFDW